jgi:cysteine-rich repeat protein
MTGHIERWLLPAVVLGFGLASPSDARWSGVPGSEQALLSAAEGAASCQTEPGRMYGGAPGSCAPLVELHAQVGFEGGSGPGSERWSQPIGIACFTCTDGTEPACELTASCNPTTDANGAATCLVPEGEYVCCAKHAHTLQSCVGVAATGATNDVDFGVLAEGDCDDDNCIGLTDVWMLSACYGLCEGQPDFDPQADLDTSGCIVLMDFSLLAANYLQCGDEPPAPVTNCGDGLLRGVEGCDDGNLADGDGCSAACEIEASWTCSGEPSSCAPLVELRAQVGFEGGSGPGTERWSQPIGIDCFICTDGIDPACELAAGCNPTTDVNGVATCSVPQGEYVCCAKHTHTLQSCVGVAATAATNDVDFGILAEGDCDDDNCIGLTDVWMLSSCFGLCEGHPDFDPQADLDTSGCIVLMDFSLLAENYLQCGDEPPAPLIGGGDG